MGDTNTNRQGLSNGAPPQMAAYHQPNFAGMQPPMKPGPPPLVNGQSSPHNPQASKNFYPPNQPSPLQSTQPSPMMQPPSQDPKASPYPNIPSRQGAYFNQNTSGGPSLQSGPPRPNSQPGISGQYVNSNGPQRPSDHLTTSVVSPAPQAPQMVSNYSRGPPLPSSGQQVVPPPQQSIPPARPPLQTGGLQARPPLQTGGLQTRPPMQPGGLQARPPLQTNLPPGQNYPAGHVPPSASKPGFPGDTSQSTGPHMPPPLNSGFNQNSAPPPPPLGMSGTPNRNFPPSSQSSAPNTGYGPPPNTAYAPPPHALNTSYAPPPPSQPHPLNTSYTSPLSQPQAPNTYPSYPMKNAYPGMGGITQGMSNLSVTQQGFNKLWGMETVDLLQTKNILPAHKITPPPIKLSQEFFNSVNCAPEIFCCTINKIPETNNLLQKSRLPLGVLIHPFRDLSQLAVIQCSSIVRCRACRTYINPFVYFIDNKRWKCNLCFRINELPDEFQYDPVSKTYGDPSRRPEIKSSTIEFIAPSEYMLRPPQPAIYLFILDVSRNACDSGYLATFCSTLLEELDNLPGDSRTQIGFILVDSYIHFYSIAENFSQAHELVVTDIDDIFLPTPDSLLVNLNENRQLIRDLIEDLPRRYSESFDTDCALGPALQAAFKLMSPTGGRVTVFQSCLPNKGPGALTSREDPNQRSAKEVNFLGPQTDFYKRLSLDCSTQQIAVDLFLVNCQYSDLATLGGISQFSGGCIYHFPLFRKSNIESNEKLTRSLRRYLTRKIGFEAVMRVRCSRGLAIHTFHGNFFVRSTDLLSLPNVNPDAGFGMQVTIEDNLSELQTVCFQAAVLYTSSKGERRIRVHTMCLPVSSNLSDVLNSADQQAIIALLSKMAVDRSLKSSLSDAREAFINVAIDILSTYKLVETSGGPNSMLAPLNLALVPLYILALLKSTAFRTGSSTRLDDRVFAMTQMKTLPLKELIQTIHPDLYDVTRLNDETTVEYDDKAVAQPARLSLSSEHLDSRGVYILDTPDTMYLVIGRNAPTDVVYRYLDTVDQKSINEMLELPELENEESEKLRHFVSFLQSEKPTSAVLRVVTEPKLLTHFLIMDKSESSLSYYELLQHVKAQIK